MPFPPCLGAVLMMVAVVPLARLPSMATGRIVQAGATLSATLAPFRDGRFWRLVVFGCWFSFFNGVTQSAHYAYPKQVLGITLFGMLALREHDARRRIRDQPVDGKVGRSLGQPARHARRAC